MMYSIRQKPKCYEGNDNYVFISYSHKNQTAVWEDILVLQKNGYRVWFDDGLHIGDNWKDNVFVKIKANSCSGIIVYISEESFYSEALMNELKWAERYSKRILSIIIDSRLPDEIYDSIISGLNQPQIGTATTILRYFPPDNISLFRIIPDEEYYVKLFKVLDTMNVKKQALTEKSAENEIFENKRCFIADKYPCINFTREFSFFNKIDDTFANVISSKEYLVEEKTDISEEKLVRMVMLAKKEKKNIINKVALRQIDFFNNEKMIFSAKSKIPINCRYAEDVKSRGYNVIYVDMFLTTQLLKLIKTNIINIMKTQLFIYGAEGVVSIIEYEVKFVKSNKNIENNPDKQEIQDLYTKSLHYSIYKIVSNSLLMNNHGEL